MGLFGSNDKGEDTSEDDVEEMGNRKEEADFISSLENAKEELEDNYDIKRVSIEGREKSQVRPKLLVVNVAEPTRGNNLHGDYVRVVQVKMGEEYKEDVKNDFVVSMLYKIGGISGMPDKEKEMKLENMSSSDIVGFVENTYVKN